MRSACRLYGCVPLGSVHPKMTLGKCWHCAIAFPPRPHNGPRQLLPAYVHLLNSPHTAEFKAQLNYCRKIARGHFGQLA